MQNTLTKIINGHTTPRDDILGRCRHRREEGQDTSITRHSKAGGDRRRNGGRRVTTHTGRNTNNKRSHQGGARRDSPTADARRQPKRADRVQEEGYGARQRNRHRQGAVEERVPDKAPRGGVVGSGEEQVLAEDVQRPGRPGARRRNTRTRQQQVLDVAPTVLNGPRSPKLLGVRVDRGSHTSEGNQIT